MLKSLLVLSVTSLLTVGFSAPASASVIRCRNFWGVEVVVMKVHSRILDTQACVKPSSLNKNPAYWTPRIDKLVLKNLDRLHFEPIPGDSTADQGVLQNVQNLVLESKLVKTPDDLYPRSWEVKIKEPQQVMNGGDHQIIFSNFLEIWDHGVQRGKACSVHMELTEEGGYISASYSTGSDVRRLTCQVLIQDWDVDPK